MGAVFLFSHSCTLRTSRNGSSPGADAFSDLLKLNALRLRLCAEVLGCC